MPVVLLGGPLFVARAAAVALGRVSPEVRAVTRDRGDAEALRAVGAKVAVGEIPDADVLEPALAGAHTLCVLEPGRAHPPDRPDDEGAETAEFVLDRARAAGLRRIIVVVSASSAGAMAIEPAARDSGMSHVILRTSFLYGPGSEELLLVRDMARARPFARMVGPGTQRWAPVFVEDLGQVLAGADDRAEVASGTWGLDGPEVIAMKDLVALLAGRPRASRSVKPGRRGFGVERGIALGNEALELLSGDLIAGPPSAAEEFGVTLTPLRDGLGRSLN
jgi:uncharacterized protein YbjT (DUF2867 family)